MSQIPNVQPVESPESKSLKTEVNDICLEVLNRKNWGQFKDLEVKVKKKSNVLGAQIAFKDRKISVFVGEDFNEAVERTIKEEKLGITRQEYMGKSLGTIVTHEYGHHRICPVNKSGFEEILNGCYDAIKGREIRESNILSICAHLQNMFSDTVLNTVNAHRESDKEDYREGLDLTYLLMANYSKHEAKSGGLLSRALGGRMDKAQALFLNTNQVMCGCSPEMIKRMKKYSPRFFSGYSRKRKKVIDIFTGNKTISAKILAGCASESEYKILIDRLEEMSFWRDMAFQYSSIMYPLLKQKQKWLQNSFTREEEEEESGGGEAGEEQKREESQEGGNEKKKESSGREEKKKEVKKGSDNKEEEEQACDKRNYKLFDRISKRIKRDPSSYLNQIPKLDKLYRERAGIIDIYAEEEENSPQFQKDVGSEEMPFSEFSSRGIDWGSTRIIERSDGGKKVELYRGNVPIVFPFEAPHEFGGIPDLAFILDSSISMGFEPIAGVGEYHTAVLAFYSILKSLEEKGTAHLMNFSVTNFSDLTDSSGWCDYSSLGRAKRSLFNYQGGNTVLKPEAMANLRKTRRDNFLCFMLSDTGFNYRANELEILEEVDRMIDSGAVGFYLFQLGGESWFSSQVEKRNAVVDYVSSAEDFRKKSIKITKEIYPGGVR